MGLFMKKEGLGFRSVVVFPTIEEKHTLDGASIGSDHGLNVVEAPTLVRLLVGSNFPKLLP